MTLPAEPVDVVVIGGGIVGLAAARAVLERRPTASVLVLEKEGALARHQSGRNSGVLHTGVYYPPGSAKAALVREGRAELLALCADHAVPVRTLGKVIVATDAGQRGSLAVLADRARAHGIEHELLGPAGLRGLEPAASGVAALHLPGAAVVDFPGVCRALAADLARQGAQVRVGAQVTGIADDRHEFVLACGDGERVRARRVLNCAGLHADTVARLVHTTRPDVRIVPFRGEFHLLRAPRDQLVRGLVYPVPDPALPFLGVHLTRDVHDRVHVGPNAVLAMGREHYERRRPTRGDARAVAAMLRDPALWRLGAQHWRTGVQELVRSRSRRRFAAAATALVPGIAAADLLPHPAGIRAQAVRDDGTLVDDFAFVVDERAVSVLNAPSPAATAALAIGRHIAAQLLNR